MNLIEVTYPEGSLDADDRAAIADEITASLRDFDEAPEATMRRARAMTHVVFHAGQSWATGDGPLSAEQPPPLLVTLTVPEAWREEVSKGFMDIIRGALEHHGASGDAERPGGDVWINVVGIADGSIGLNGMPSTADDVLMYMTEEYRASADDADLPDGVVIDPICGMQVPLDKGAPTLVHEGETIGFCSQGCRSNYARMQGIALPA